jgi:hypothetical protein
MQKQARCFTTSRAKRRQRKGELIRIRRWSGALQLLFRGIQHSSNSLGSRYRSRSAAHIVWEVIAQYKGFDGLPYVTLRNLSDQTWQKTMSQTELERGEQYSRVTEGFQSR